MSGTNPDLSGTRVGRMKEQTLVVDTYEVHDARDIAEHLRGGPPIDVTITSPPYWNVKDYGVADQIGFGQKYDQFLDDVGRVFGAIYDHTRDSGSLWVVCDTVKHNGELRLLPFDLSRRLKCHGWILQDIIIWTKDKTLPWSHQGKLRNIFEYVLFYSKTQRFNYHLRRIREVSNLREWWVRYPERYSAEGKAPARTWFVPIPRQGSWGVNWVRHNNPLPPTLVERIVELTTDRGDTVLDPFAGSGAVLAQAHAMGRHYIGTDLNPAFREMFYDRVLPAVVRQNERSHDGVRTEKGKKAKFARLIRALRMTKYPKELMRLYSNAFGRPAVHSIWLFRGRTSKRMNVVFVIDARRVPANIVEELDTLASRPPLSKYEISAELSAITLTQLDQRWLEEHHIGEGDRLYLYEDGKTYWWKRSYQRGGALEWSRNQRPDDRNGHPPIVANIRIRVDPKRPPF